MTTPPRSSPMAASSAPVRATDDSPHHMDTARPSVSALWRDLTVPTVGDRRRSRPLPVLQRAGTAPRDRRHRLVTPPPPYAPPRCGRSHAPNTPSPSLPLPSPRTTHHPRPSTPPPPPSLLLVPLPPTPPPRPRRHPPSTQHPPAAPPRCHRPRDRPSCTPYHSPPRPPARDSRGAAAHTAPAAPCRPAQRPAAHSPLPASP